MKKIGTILKSKKFIIPAIITGVSAVAIVIAKARSSSEAVETPEDENA
jgi:hypothetical protein